jgi:hypothetical protein
MALDLGMAPRCAAEFVDDDMMGMSQIEDAFTAITLPPGTFFLSADLDDRLRRESAAPQRCGGLAHPVFAFVAGLGGMGLPVAEAIGLCGCSMKAGPLLASCEITIHKPLRVGLTYRVQASIAEKIRKPSRRFGAADHLLFRFDLDVQGERFAELALHMIVPQEFA